MIDIQPVKALRDNYVWVLTDRKRNCLVVDPGEASPVLEHLEARQLTLRGILITHHHPDHVGGISKLLEQFPVPVYGPAREQIPGMTDPLDDGRILTIEQPAVSFRVLHIPGHTLGHIALYSEDGERPMLFSGDTLFAAGCGRLFEGTPEQMLASLDRMAALPEDTLLYCGHEYTVKNLEFAASVTPDNEDVRTRLLRARATRSADRPTLPSTLAAERSTNPFLRTDAEDIQAAVARDEPEAAGHRLGRFTALRGWRDRF